MELDQGESVTGFSASQQGAEPPASDGYHILVKSNSDFGGAQNVTLYNVSSMVEPENANNINNSNNKDNNLKRFEHVSTLHFDSTTRGDTVSCELVRNGKTIVASVPDVDGVVFFKLCKDI